MMEKEIVKSANLERLLELISREEVVLFAGAGLSKYAGYPLGGELQKIFYDKLSNKEKEEVSSVSSLVDTVEQIFYLRNSNSSEIIRTLKENYLKEPTNYFVHKNISNIPHFKTIITTNYDQLFERAYKENGEILYKNEHVSLSEPTKIQIYKIHGDLILPETIILKKSDYTNFFNSSTQNSVYWNSVKNIMASNSILFVGYSLEDSNIDFIFDEIIRQLGEFKKEIFFVSPSISETKRNKLSKHGISYIEGTGETLFSTILSHLNENIILDVQKKKVSLDTSYKFAEKLGYSLTIGTNTASEYFLEKLERKDGLSSQKMNFTIENDKKFIKSLQSFIGNNTLDKKFVIPKDKLLKFDFRVDNFKLHDLSNIDKVYLMKLPNYDGFIDIIFEDGFELNDFYIKIFKNNLPVRTVLNFETKVNIGTLSISDTKKGLNFKYDSEIAEFIEKPRLLLDYYTSLLKIMSGENFTILVNGKEVFTRKFNEVKIPKDLLFFKNFLELLVKVEKTFKVRFKDFRRDEINEENEFYLRCLVAKSENKFVEIPGGVLTAITDNSFDKGFLQINEEKHVLFINENKYTNFTINGINFNLGYKRTYMFDATIVNIEDVKNEVTNEIKIKNKTNTRHITFTDTYETIGTVTTK